MYVFFHVQHTPLSHRPLSDYVGYCIIVVISRSRCFPVVPLMTRRSRRARVQGARAIIMYRKINQDGATVPEEAVFRSMLYKTRQVPWL